MKDMLLIHSLSTHHTIHTCTMYQPIVDFDNNDPVKLVAYCQKRKEKRPVGGRNVFHQLSEKTETKEGILSKVIYSSTLVLLIMITTYIY